MQDVVLRMMLRIRRMIWTKDYLRMELNMKLLHITTHMGGGAGNAISDIIIRDRKNEHRLICLQGCEKRQFVDRCVKKGICVLEQPEESIMSEEIEHTDILILHWWHHPVMCGFLARFPKIPCRLVLWSHISGCTYPMLRKSFVDLFDRVFMTSPYSYDNPEWHNAECEEIRKKSDIVYGLGNLEAFRFEIPSGQTDEKFVVGYVGTLGNAKIHENFTEFCEEVINRIPQTRFLMVGDLADAGWLLKEIEQKRLGEYFEFTGYCVDVKSQLTKMDVFGYPLNKKHFGTTENALLEAMTAKLPVVALNQNTEKYIVSHLNTGMLVGDKQEYADAMDTLYRDPQLRKAMGERARAAVLEKYSVQRNMEVFLSGLELVREREKRFVSFEAQSGKQPYEWFLSGLGTVEKRWFQDSLKKGWERELAEDRIRTCMPILRAKSKCSVFQFAEYYPDDQVLRRWKKIIEKGEQR